MAYQDRETSYQKAVRNTFSTTYKRSYGDVDTYHRSPVYTERDFYSPPPVEKMPYYQRLSYPYQGNHAIPNGAVDHTSQLAAHGMWRGFYDYEATEDPRFRRFRQRPANPEEPPKIRRPLPVDKTFEDQEIITMPIEKKSCHACPEPEAYAPKSTNQLRCYHKYCDNCITKLVTTIEPYGDISAQYFHCAICPNSRTAGPSIIRFDPYGRRVPQLPGIVNGTIKDPIEKQYNPVLANPEDLKEPQHNRPFCHGCFKTNECVNRLGCGHRFCDACFYDLHCTDNPFRYETCLHYFCIVCSDKTPEPKVIRFDPFGRRLLKFRDLHHYR